MQFAYVACKKNTFYLMTENKHNKNKEHDIPVKDPNEGQVKKDTQATEALKKTESKEPKELSIEEKLALVKDENAKLKDQILRQMAEFDNYRKRTLKEKAELILNGAEKTLSALLPILDDLERAEKNIKQNANLTTLKEGVDLVFKKFRDTLEKQGLKAIETKDKDFNTDFHEAVAMVPVPNDKQKGKVIDCVQTGYTLNDKVIRHAKVAVGQ